MPNELTLELPDTLIETFKLDNGNLYVAKRDIDGIPHYGVSVSKSDAIKGLGTHYADLGTPAVLLMPGDQIKAIPIPIYSIPGAIKFLDCLLTFELRQSYSFGVVYLEETNEVCLICKPTINPNKEHFILSTQGGYMPDQVRRCAYQLYIEQYEKNIELDLKINPRNAKLREWLKLWYNKLPNKGFHS